jgi:hypothetical protein
LTGKGELSIKEKAISLQERRPEKLQSFQERKDKSHVLVREGAREYLAEAILAVVYHSFYRS